MNNFFNNKKTKEREESEVYNDVFIPKEYKNTILRHVLLNYSGNINGVSVPLFLAIQGFRGEGKTFMIEKMCKFYEIDAKFVSSSELCGPLEGDSKNYIKQKYESICEEVSHTKHLTIIVIDDFHLSIASDYGENVSKTSNSQVLTSYLMNLADNPWHSGIRVPIVMIGNNFQNVYPALIRNGRMNFFKWEPSLTDKEKIVYHMYKRFYPRIKFEETKRLVNKYQGQNIAFFESVIQECFFNNFELVIREFEKQYQGFTLDGVNGLVLSSLKVNENVSCDNLMVFAKNCAENREGNFETRQ